MQVELLSLLKYWCGVDQKEYQVKCGRRYDARAQLPSLFFVLSPGGASPEGEQYWNKSSVESSISDC